MSLIEFKLNFTFFCCKYSDKENNLITEHIDLQIGGSKIGLTPNVSPLAVTVLCMLSELTGLLDDDVNS